MCYVLHPNCVLSLTFLKSPCLTQVCKVSSDLGSIVHYTHAPGALEDALRQRTGCTW